jgi:hypothetical protein
MLAGMIGGCGDSPSTGPVVGGDTLCIRYYAQCVDPILHTSLTSTTGSAASCSGSGTGCHLQDVGVGGTFKVNRPAGAESVPPDYSLSDSEYQTNFTSSERQSGGGTNSNILLKPLQGGVSHGGPKLFANTSDPNYQRILYWLSNRVPDQGSLVAADDTPQCAALFNASSPDPCTPR